MIEDKLTHNERLRLECLAQANATAAGARVQATTPGNGRESIADAVVAVARKYEAFVRDDAGQD